MEKITYINPLGQRVEFDSEPYILIKIENTGAVNTNILTEKSPGQDGVTYLDNNLSNRDIPIQILVKAENEEQMFKYRHELINVFNPKLGPGTLKYEYDGGVKQIKAVSELAPTFPDVGDFKDTMQDALIQLYCPGPFWFDTDYSIEEIITWTGGARFPVKFPISFAIKGSTRKNVINSGDVETPVEVTFKGPATNPCVTNLSTDEFIKVNRDLTADDTLIINTEFGNKKVYIADKSGNKTNVFNWIDLNSTFFNLKVGDNIIEYSSDNGVEPASVSIKYCNRYIGV